MGSSVTVKKPRLKKDEYEMLKQKIGSEQFYTYYLNNGNEAVCQYFGISLGTMYRLLKDFNIKLTQDQKVNRNKIATEQIILAKYGVNSAFEIPMAQEKIKNTNLKHYGVENPFQATEVKNKIKQTCLNKYGVEYAAQAKSIKDKIKQTCIETYGVDNYAKTAECRDKIIKTCLDRYGRSNIGQFGSPEHLKAIIDKYGVEYYSQTQEARQKQRVFYKYDSEYFDSLPELAVWVYAKNHNIEIIRLPLKIKYIFNNSEHYYFPDFLYNGNLLEIKGDHLYKKMLEEHTLENAKYQCMQKNKVLV